MSSLFGGSAPAQNQQQQQPAGTGLFSYLNKPGNTFGGGAAAGGGQQTGSPSLFGSAGNTNNNAPAGGSSLFGGNNANSNSNPQQASTPLFGGNTASSNPAQPAGNSLFGGNAAGSTQQQPAASLFGGNTGAAQTGTSSLFGGHNAANNTQQPGGSLFGGNAQPQASTMNNPNPSNAASLLQSGLGTSHYGALGALSQNELAKSRLTQLNIDSRPSSEKPIPERIQNLIRKWDPNSQETLLQDYTYNAVNAAYAPFYYKNADETEKKWEEALSKKPANIETKDGESISFIPVLVRGFRALGERAEVQARTVNEMRTRLHEMNNSLTAVMAKHQQVISVELEAARRQHVVLSQRCLRLAAKVQILRNRGYALDGAEEGLRKSLQALEKAVFDPGFTGREEEIWARMVALRDRMRWLEEEGQRLGGRVGEEQNRAGVPEEVINKTKRILRDYDGQLVHLGKELEGVKKEFTQWEEARKSSRR